jgi:hypothetical protein
VFVYSKTTASENFAIWVVLESNLFAIQHDIFTFIHSISLCFVRLIPLTRTLTHILNQFLKFSTTRAHTITIIIAQLSMRKSKYSSCTLLFKGSLEICDASDWKRLGRVVWDGWWRKMKTNNVNSTIVDVIITKFLFTKEQLEIFSIIFHFNAREILCFNKRS